LLKAKASPKVYSLKQKKQLQLTKYKPILYAALGVVSILPARGGELVRLSNGFTISCDHHATVDGHLRAYTGSDSYIDLNTAEVSSIEHVETPPEPAESTSPATPQPLSKQDLHQILAGAGQTHNLDVDLLASLVRAESAGNTHAVSPKGARGLMQLMPGTAAELGVQDRDDAGQNVNGGSAYLDSLLTRYHENLALALAAYNAGPAAVDRYKGVPPYRETRLYVAKVIHEFNKRVRARQALEAKNSPKR
jgi:soluble lytic murein transglycosylase-like protein